MIDFALSVETCNEHNAGIPDVHCGRADSMAEDICAILLRNLISSMHITRCTCKNGVHDFSKKGSE